jgi:orotate phosphoribosyltransferase
MTAAANELCATLNTARKAAAASAAGSDGDSAAASSSSSSAAALKPHQLDFLRCALSEGVLRFGDFTLKSGRSSPYFFNAGLFTRGGAISRVGRAYARAIIDCGVEYDVVFGPAYKGIPLATAVGMSLAALGHDRPVAYNRKEAKDHGEGGLLVGAGVKGQRVLLVDDVMSSGKAVMEAAEILCGAGATLAGVVVGLDRQERRSAEDSSAATDAVAAALGVPVFSVARLDDLIRLMSASSADETLTEHVEAMRAYRAEWGV